MAIFRFFKMADVCQLGFLNVQILTASTVHRADMHYHSKFRADHSGTVADILLLFFFNFSSWRLSAILDFMMSSKF